MTARRIVVVSGLVTAALSVVPAGPAQASVSTGYLNGVLTVTSDGASDVIVLTCQGGVRLNGNAIPGAPAGCGVDVVVDGNGGNDTIDTTALNNAADSVDLDGGDGDDVISAGEASNPANSDVVVTGGPGNDVLRMRNGDSVTGGDGDDVFEVSNSLHSATTLLQGGNGTDTYKLDLSGLPATGFEMLPVGAGLVVTLGGALASTPWSSMELVDMVLTDGSETVHGEAFPGRLRLDGRGGNDLLFGSGQADVLVGGAGNDTADGHEGADSFDGGDGDDVLRARDTSADSVACGAGADIAVIDPTDSTSGCETRDTGSSSDTSRPKPKFSGAKVAGSKLKLKASCPDTELRCVGDASLTVKGKRGAAARSIKLGDVLIVADGGRADRISFSLTAAQRRAVVGLTHAKLRVVYDVIDAGGNAGRGRVTIPLKS